MTSFSMQSAILPELLKVGQIGQKQPKIQQKWPYLAFITYVLKNYLITFFSNHYYYYYYLKNEYLFMWKKSEAIYL